jgi:carbon storage regulator
MLVLKRDVGQSIIIDNNIIITVLTDTQGQVKLGIDAPTDISVHREEVYERIMTDDE